MHSGLLACIQMIVPWVPTDYSLARGPVNMLATTIDKHVKVRLPGCGKRNGLPQPDVHGIVLAVVRQFPRFLTAS